MPDEQNEIPVYLEQGAKRVFACALEWPGWSRSAMGAEAALQALYSYGQRYASAVAGAQAGFAIPAGPAEFTIVERLKGDATTDFGAPTKVPAYDLEQLDMPEVERLKRLLTSTWQSFDRIVLAAQGKELRKGPRGGGRELEKVVRHVLESEGGYLANLGVKHPIAWEKDLTEELQDYRRAVLEGLERSARGELPEFGPRGGQRWKVRQFVRRAAWHVLDHAWEIEDRSV